MINERGWNVWLRGAGLGILSQANPRCCWSAKIKRDIHVDSKTGHTWISFCGAHIGVDPLGDGLWWAHGGLLGTPVLDLTNVKPLVRVRFDRRLELIASLHGPARRRTRGPRHYKPVGSEARI